MQDSVFTVTKRKKTAQINMKILPELKEAADRAAEDESRTLTSLVEHLLKQHLKKGGYWPPAGSTHEGEAE